MKYPSLAGKAAGGHLKRSNQTAELSDDHTVTFSQHSSTTVSLSKSLHCGGRKRFQRSAHPLRFDPLGASGAALKPTHALLGLAKRRLPDGRGQRTLPPLPRRTRPHVTSAVLPGSQSFAVKALGAASATTATVSLAAGVALACGAVLAAVLDARARQETPQVFCTRTSFAERIVKQCTGLAQLYRPFPALVNCHVETIFAALFRKSPELRYWREVVEMPHGGCVTLDWPLESGERDSPALPPDAPVLLLLPGLTGGSQDSYVQHQAMSARERGFRPVVFNSRGCADSPVTTPQFYSAGFTADLRELVRLLRARYPPARLYAAGWSLGANILTKYVGEEGEGCLLTAAAALCNPFDLTLCNRALREGFGKVYDKNLANKLREMMSKQRALFAGPGLQVEKAGFNAEKACEATTIREFDDYITRISFGYMTVEQYYAANSSRDWIANVQIPMLFLSALDDPISVKEAIPYEQIAANEQCILATTPHGGHLGWVTEECGAFGAPWSDAVVTQFLCAVQEHAVQEHAVQERAVQEHAVQEHAVQERAAQEHAVQERAAQEHAVQERAAQEHAVQERAAQEHAVQERAAQEHAVQERAAQEHAVEPPPDAHSAPATTAGMHAADINGAAVHGTHVNNAKANGAGMNSTRVNGAKANGAGMNNTSVNGAKANGAGMNGTSVNGAKANGAVMNGSSVNGAKANGAGMNGTNVNGAKANGAGMIGTNVNGAKANGAGMNGTSVNGAKVNGADMGASRVNNADVHGANVGDSGMSGTDELGVYGSSVLLSEELALLEQLRLCREKRMLLEQELALVRKLQRLDGGATQGAAASTSASEGGELTLEHELVAVNTSREAADEQEGIDLAPVASDYSSTIRALAGVGASAAAGASNEREVRPHESTLEMEEKKSTITASFETMDTALRTMIGRYSRTFASGFVSAATASANAFQKIRADATQPALEQAGAREENKTVGLEASQMSQQNRISQYDKGCDVEQMCDGSVMFRFV